MPHSLLWNYILPRWRGWILPGMVVFLMLYTADELFTGDRGMVTWRVMRTQIADLKQDIETLNAEIADLNGRIDRLKGVKQPNGKLGSPDKDFVDELLRRDLGVLHQGEGVILVSKTNL
jgi:cell division protein FtsB